MLVLTTGVSVINAGYTAKPGSFSSSNNTEAPLSAGTTNTQYKMGKLGLGKSGAPTRYLDVDGTAYIEGNMASYGIINVGSNLNVNGKLFLNNITLTGKPGVRKLCANRSASFAGTYSELTACPPASGVWYRNTPGSHVFDPAVDLPAGVTSITVQLWGGGGNSVPRTDSNPGNAGNETNPADPSYVTIYNGAVSTGNVLKAEEGKMGYGTTTFGSTMQTGGAGGRGYVNGVEQVSAKGGNGGNPAVLPVVSCLGGSGGASATATFSISGGSVTVGGSGGQGGGLLSATPNGRGNSADPSHWGAGGGGFGRVTSYAAGAWCTTKIIVGGKLVTPMSGGGGAGAHVVKTYTWNEISGKTLKIDIGEGGINNYDWMTGNGANGGVLITW